MRLRIDIETRCKLDIKHSGVYRYATHPSFKVLLFAFTFLPDDNSYPVLTIDNITAIDLTKGDLPQYLKDALVDPRIKKFAFNANFERVCLSVLLGTRLDPSQWFCTMVLSAFNGLPLSLEGASKALNLVDGKFDGSDCINKFSRPSQRKNVEFNAPEDYPDMWEKFIYYVKRDVLAEYNVEKNLLTRELPELERQYYIESEIENDNGVRIDTDLVESCLEADAIFIAKAKEEGIKKANIPNIASDKQFLPWLKTNIDPGIEDCKKETIKKLFYLDLHDSVKEVLNIRKEVKKSSVAKYTAMKNHVVGDMYYGLLQYYGANRTGRYAARGVQVHNLPKNYTDEIDLLHDLLRSGNYEEIIKRYKFPRQILSELLRTCFIPLNGNIFYIADFSAIEARVVAWLTGEEWRLNVFRDHGKIYEASAAMMFSIAIESVTTEERAKGKICELALGYGGSLGAFYNMGYDTIKKMKMSDEEIKTLIRLWREKSPNIVAFWRALNNAAMSAVANPGVIFTAGKIQYCKYRDHLLCKLPSGRKLYYYKPSIGPGKYGPCLKYMGYNKDNVWTEIETHGGKLLENTSQAIARDCLTEAKHNLYTQNIITTFHVHDELITQQPKSYGDQFLDYMCTEMSKPTQWREDLLLSADGFTSKYYKKAG